MTQIKKIIFYSIAFCSFTLLNVLEVKAVENVYDYTLDSAPVGATTNLNCGANPTRFNNGSLEHYLTSASCGSIEFKNVDLTGSTDLESYLYIDLEDAGGFDTAYNRISWYNSSDVAILHAEFYDSGPTMDKLFRAKYNGVWENIGNAISGNTKYIKIFWDSSGVDFSAYDTGEVLLFESLNNSITSYTKEDVAYTKIITSSTGNLGNTLKNYTVTQNLYSQGLCGLDDGTSSTTEPTALCDNGTFGGFDTSPPQNWTWDCVADTTTNCETYYQYNGVCKDYSGSYQDIEPVDLCIQGTPTTVFYSIENEQWTWTCDGVSGGLSSPLCNAFKTPNQYVLALENHNLYKRSKVFFNELQSNDLIKDFFVQDSYENSLLFWVLQLAVAGIYLSVVLVGSVGLVILVKYIVIDVLFKN